MHKPNIANIPSKTGIFPAWNRSQCEGYEVYLPQALCLLSLQFQYSPFSSHLQAVECLGGSTCEQRFPIP